MEHTMPRRTRAEIDPLFAEVEVLGTLVKQMAEAMSDLEARVEDQQAIAPPPQMPSLPRYQQPQETYQEERRSTYQAPQNWPPVQQPAQPRSASSTPRRPFLMKRTTACRSPMRLRLHRAGT